MYKNITLIVLSAFILQSYSQESYYNDVNLNVTGITLKEELALKIINTHTRFLSYDQIWNASKKTDVNPNNNTQVLLVYGWENGTDSDITNNRERGLNDNSGDVGDWNREHVYSRSLGTPNLGESGPGADAHHLRPCDVQRNSSRNNRKFTDGSGNSGIQSNGGWFPGDEWKGDVARMMMYMYLRYNDRCLASNVGFGDNSSTPDNMIDLFLKWNAEDPVSNFEKQRNDYHENSTNTEAQGNRNPFIDNPRLATRIWDGPEAEDTWGIFTNQDTEAPSTPTNLNVTNITTFSIDLSWTASTDNIGVTSYDIYIDGNLKSSTSETSFIISDLLPKTSYSFTIIAKDIANNSSNLSVPLNIETLEDTTPPSIPENIEITNQTGTSFIINWTTSTDNTKVSGYEVYLNNQLNGSIEDISYTATGLSLSTTYKIEILAIDISGNKSSLSAPINATTTDGSTTTANELFFSEYVEGSSNNKALEIANVTSENIDLSTYSLKRQKNGGVDNDVWENELKLTGTILKNDVYVIINGNASIQKLIDEADFIQPNASQTNFGAPINFNGDDPVGLFKNDVLIDIIGTYNSGGGNFAKDKTLRRKNDISEPNTAFDINNEWEVYPKDNVENIGQHNATLSINRFENSGLKVYPIPTNDKILILNSNNIKILKIEVFNSIGKRILSKINISNEIDVKNLSKGIYILKFATVNKTYSTKFIKK